MARRSRSAMRYADNESSSGQMNIPLSCAVVFCIAAPANAQPAQGLGRLVWSSKASFTAITGVRELSDGRIIVTDRTEKRIVALSPEGHASTDIGRPGEGPGEFTIPGPPLPLGADTTMIPDPMLRRYLVIAPDLRIVRSTSFPAAAGWAPTGRIAGPLEEIFGAAGMPSPDTPWVTLTRLSLRTHEIHPVVRLAMPAPVPLKAGGRRIVVNPSFAAMDAFAVAPDGRIAVVRVAPYRVEWYTREGKRLAAGAPVLYDPVPLAENERQGPFGTAVPGPSSKPPFDPEHVHIASSGVLWVGRNERLGTVSRRYDLFCPEAQWLGTVTLPAHRVLAGFGARYTYVVYTDSDGLQWLERYVH